MVTHVLTGHWDPSETAFAVLNRETPADVRSVFVTIAADLVISQVYHKLPKRFFRFKFGWETTVS